MARELIYKEDARRAILNAMPNLAWTIDRIHPVEGETASHGQWNEHLYESYSEPVYECSKCDFWTQLKYTYCPGCGQKNIGGVNHAASD
jgi:hypothetical protein